MKLPAPLLTALTLVCLATGCPPADSKKTGGETAATDTGATALSDRAKAIFGVLPKEALSADNPTSEAKVALGQMLYFDPRLSKNQQISCNSCHLVDKGGVDGEPTSPGHKGQRGGRNSPTVLNAALQSAGQFWDAREPNVEAQAKGPVLNPIEMAMPSAEHVVNVLKSIPGYAAPFKAAFGGDDPITYDNMAKAIGSYERKLLTPGAFDAFMGGDAAALNEQAQRGLTTFLDTGCIACHMGPVLGGAMLQKLGLVEPYETKDLGRFEVTKKDSDKFFFKVPQLRNIAQTGPYFHDGSVATLEEAITLMAKHQLGKTLTEAQVADIVAFFKSLDGELEAGLKTKPTLPESGPDTPAADPN
jgi:cytochrome c peroxidase